jgi:flagellar export protein FliJ
MPFHYPFQSILHFRQSLEHQEEQRLFAIAAAVERLRSELDAWERSRVEQSRIFSQQMITGSVGAVLQFAALCDVNALAVQNQLRMRLAEMERQRLAQLSVYQNTRQKREIFEELRDCQEENYQRDVERREQERADDNFLMRYTARSDD